MDYLKPTAAVILPNIGGWAGSYFSKKHMTTWYDPLKKPSWTPPKWAFPPVWTGLYCGMGYASYLVWRDGGGFDGDAKWPLALYGTQLALNWAWTPIFFGTHKLLPAAVEISVLWGAVGGCILAFRPINQTASFLMVPYLGWISLASALSWWIYANNREPSTVQIKEIKEDKAD